MLWSSPPSCYASLMYKHGQEVSDSSELLYVGHRSLFQIELRNPKALALQKWFLRTPVLPFCF